MLSPPHSLLPKENGGALRAMGGWSQTGAHLVHSRCTVQLIGPNWRGCATVAGVGAMHTAVFRLLGYGQGSETDAHSSILSPGILVGVFMGFPPM